MNKQVFNFHFLTMFYWFVPNFGNWRRMAVEFFWYFPAGVILGLDHKKLLEATWADIPTMLWWWLWFGFLGVAMAGVVLGILYGVIQMFRFEGYDLIERSPGYRAFQLTRDERKFRQYCLQHIPKEKEKIIAVANLTQDGIAWCVMCPGRHHHGIWYMAQFDRNHDPMQQGFLTNKFRFLGRQDARKLAMANGQSPTTHHHRDLFSEDLWRTPSHLRQQG